MLSGQLKRAKASMLDKKCLLSELSEIGLYTRLQYMSVPLQYIMSQSHLNYIYEDCIWRPTPHAAVSEGGPGMKRHMKGWIL